ncbi:NUDIX domain-containing protein [Mycetocola spongiae]|uniref:NUDIX domain-containing protein n=1 Tax=Mycetocola spongiae TaxID=2859226 RepID=UPI001CF15FE6|nr:NUDIX hydrolase [Mycetocola spongiae]UCR90209.1 NUDIX hydrolase [Mycetocola spongiae]
MSELPRDVPSTPPVTQSERVFEGAVWDIRRDAIDYNGSIIHREYMDHTGAVAVLVLDERERVLLIRQYRHPVRMLDWEIPAGLLDIAGEDPVVGARRELAEEADLEASTWHLLSEIFTSPGGSSEAIRIYLARGLRELPAFAREDEEADIEKMWIDLDDAVTAVLERRIRNGVLVAGVLAADAARRAGWATLGDPREPWTTHPGYHAGS